MVAQSAISTTYRISDTDECRLLRPAKAESLIREPRFIWHCKIQCCGGWARGRLEWSKGYRKLLRDDGSGARVGTHGQFRGRRTRTRASRSNQPQIVARTI